jgi:hypothetical protein
MIHSSRRNRTALLLLVSVLAIAATAPAASAAVPNIFTAAGTGTLGFGGDGGFATSAQLNHPRGLVATGDGGYLIADSGANRVRRVLPNGKIITVAGSGTVAGSSGDGGPATSAKLNTPHGVAMMPDGGFLIADTNNHRIRRVSPSGIITTVAGTAVKGFSGDGGPANKARMSAPRGLASLPDGSYLIPDTDNNRIRKVSTSGIITTVAGNGVNGYGGDGGPATAAALNAPFAIAPLPGGGFLFADAENDRIRRVSPLGVITTVAGTGNVGFSGDGGPATSAQIGQPISVSTMPDGGFLISDTANNRVRRVSPLGIISTAAGTGTTGFSGDGGPATSARLNQPKATLAFGNAYLIADSSNARVRRVQTVSCAAPVSYYSRGPSKKARKARRFKLSGRARASSVACKVAKTSISIARVAKHGRCRNLGSHGRLARSTKCSKRKYLKAKLKGSRWSFSLKRKLPKGTYVVQVRSVDKSHKLERRRKTHGSKRNVIRFTL